MSYLGLCGAKSKLHHFIRSAWQKQNETSELGITIMHATPGLESRLHHDERHYGPQNRHALLKD